MPAQPVENGTKAGEDTGPGDACDGTMKQSSCTQRWKASAAEHQKRALSVYDTTGIFTAACRHGFVLILCEMVRSGEL